jgi:hypothetical protein
MSGCSRYIQTSLTPITTPMLNTESSRSPRSIVRSFESKKNKKKTPNGGHPPQVQEIIIYLLIVCQIPWLYSVSILDGLRAMRPGICGLQQKKRIQKGGDESQKTPLWFPN